ncbi:MAG: BatD family protein [Saprospiraceae bacterium]
MNVPCPFKCFQKNTRALGAWAGTIFFLLNFYAAFAQSDVAFEVAVGSKELVVGVPFELTFTLKNAEGTRFTPPVFPGFQTSGVSEMRGATIVNGRSTLSQTWSIFLTATRPGNYTIGSATVLTTGNRSLNTKPITLKVLSLAASNRGNMNVPPGSDDRIFIAAEFDQKEAFVGQQCTWRIRLYTQLSVEGYDLIALPDFQGFFSKEKIRYDKRVDYVTIKRKKYAVRTLHEEAMFPQETGDLMIGAARVSVGLEQPGPQGFLFGPKPVTLQTQPVGISVKALPQPSDAFTGGVGQLEWEVKADTNALSTDDALTLVVEVKGNGDPRRVAPPKIKVPANCEIFEPRILEEEEYEGETEILHRKKYEYVVLPKDTGSMQIQPELSYFNVDSNRYCQLRSATLSFKVRAGKNYQSPQILSAPPAIAAPEQPDLWTRALEWLGSPVLWSILVLPFLLIGIIVLIKKRKNTADVPILTAPRPTAPVYQAPSNHAPDLTQARKRYAEAGRLLQDKHPRRFYEVLFKAIQEWLSARYGIQTAQMNDLEISALLQQRGATPIRTQTLLSIWRTCEQAIYGGQALPDQMESSWQLAGQVMEALEKETR